MSDSARPGAVAFDGIVLAGGAARRLDGLAKPALAVGSRRLIDVSLTALAAAERIVAVGAVLPDTGRAEWCREDPPGGGPVAALAAALPAVTAAEVVVLAADLPFVTTAAIATLRAARGAAAAAIAVDADGRDQPLLGCYAAVTLRSALPERAAGASMRSLCAAVERAGGVVRVDLGGDPPVTWDCDTAQDLERAREWA